MTCELNVSDAEIAAIESEYRTRTTLCLTGEKSGYETSLAEVEESLENPLINEERFEATRELLQEQRSLLLSLINVMQDRIDAVNKTGRFSVGEVVTGDGD